MRKIELFYPRTPFSLPCRITKGNSCYFPFTTFYFLLAHGLQILIISHLSTPLLFSSLIMGRSVQAYRVISHSTVFEPRWLLDTKGQRHEPIRESYQRLLPVRSQARCSFSSSPFFISHKPCNLQHREVLDGESNRIDGRWPFLQLSTTLLHADSRTEESRVEGLRTTRLRLSLFFSQSSIWGRFVLATYSWKQFSLTRNPW